jgi:trans-aconitate methyltransferase
MDDSDARKFIAGAVGTTGNTWADIGAGTGTFTRALRSLLPAGGSRVYAIDRDTSAIEALAGIGEGVIPIQADFTDDLSLPEPLDGLLLANALHFVPDAASVLGRLVKLMKQGGRVVIVEYDRRAANPWVPSPIASSKWPDLAREAGLVDPTITARRKSEYAGELYVAVAHRK